MGAASDSVSDDELDPGPGLNPKDATFRYLTKKRPKALSGTLVGSWDCLNESLDVQIQWTDMELFNPDNFDIGIELAMKAIMDIEFDGVPNINQW